MTYPAGEFGANVLAFCDGLRRDHGFAIGTGEGVDAVRAAEAAGIGSAGAVRRAIALVCCATPEQQEAFPGLFDAFFFPGPEGVPQERMAAAADAASEEPGGGDEDARESGPPEDADGSGDGTPGSRGAAAGLGDDPFAASLAARYSPAPGTAAPPPAVAVDATMLAAAARLLARLRLGRSRRLRPMRRGHRFDLRRTLRANLGYGGELLHPRLIGRPPRHPRVVVLIDASRSMTPYAPAMVAFAAALARRTDRVDAFVFSTRLARVTADIRRGALPDLGEAWGGGTRIGDCLAAFVRDDGARLLGPETLAIIASDGLDVGDPATLRDAIRTIHRRSCAVVWVNPLLDEPGYAPTAQGMQAALPYVTTLAAAHDAAGFARLAATVRVRR